MKVIIARHAQTNENIGEVIIGQESEVLLNESGVKQAQMLADYLKNENIDFAYLSPQKRAVHTAKEVLKHHPKAKIVEVSHLKEQNLGIYESAPKHVWKEAKEKTKEPFHLFRPEGGESYIDLQNRIKIFFNKLIDKHENDTIFMVSHGGTLSVLYLHIFGKKITEENYKAHKPENTALTILEIFKDKPVKIHLINSLSHLN